MKNYREPEFEVVKTFAQDVITESETASSYTPGTFETGMGDLSVGA